jgi:RNA-directed DNA polymerase
LYGVAVFAQRQMLLPVEFPPLHFDPPSQGGVVSPCLSNVFLHHVLDEWFENEVKPRLKGKSTLVRFADDAVMAFADYRDAQRVLGVLGKRLARYGLTLHPDKTRSYRSDGKDPPETDGSSFTFLGFCHAWGKSRKGKNVVRQVTAKQRYARALAAVTEWCRQHRHLPIPEQHTQLVAKMRGHYAYYGISGNLTRLVRPQGCADLAEMAVAAGGPVPMGSVQ